MRTATRTSDPRRRSAGWTAGRAVVGLSVATTVAVAASVFGATFRLERIALALLVAAFGPVVVDGLAAAATRRQWWGAQAAAFAVGWAAVVLTLDRPSGAVASARSIVDGWSGILSTAAPALVTMGTVTVPFVLTWWASVWALVLARRTARELTPVGPAVLLAVVASLFAPTGSLPYAAWPVLFLAAAAAVGVSRLVWSPPRIEGTAGRPVGSGRTAGRAGAAVATGLLAVAVLGGVVVGMSGVGARADASVLRRWWQPEGVRVEAVDPFAVVSASVDPTIAARPLGRLTVTSRTAPGPLRLRLVAADRFDGAGWTTGGRFLPTGDGVSAPSGGGPAFPLGLVMEVDEAARLAFLPAPPLVDSIRSGAAGRVVVDEDDGMWAIAGPPGDGASRVPTGRYPITGAELADGAAPVGRTRTGQADAIPEQFAALARRWAGEGGPARRAGRLEEILRGTRAVAGFSPAVVQAAASDPSVARAESLLGLGGPDDAAAGSGTPAEFAAAFALLGRAAGLDTRLVLGVELSRPAPGRTLQLRQEDLRIWPEVLLDRSGAPVWVPFDPSPQQLRDRVPDVPDPDPAGPDAATPTTIARETIPVQGVGAADSNASGRRPVRPVGDSGTPVFRPGIPWLALLATAGLVLAVAAAVVHRRRRRDRRTRGRPAARIAAGWAEVARLLARRRVPDARSMTPAQTETAIVEAFGPPARAAAAQVHDLVDAGLFGPEEPTERDAERMWALVDELADLGRSGRRTRPTVNA